MREASSVRCGLVLLLVLNTEASRWHAADMSTLNVLCVFV